MRHRRQTQGEIKLVPGAVAHLLDQDAVAIPVLTHQTGMVPFAEVGEQPLIAFHGQQIEQCRSAAQKRPLHLLAMLFNGPAQQPGGCLQAQIALCLLDHRGQFLRRILLRIGGALGRSNLVFLLLQVPLPPDDLFQALLKSRPFLFDFMQTAWDLVRVDGIALPA